MFDYFRNATLHYENGDIPVFIDSIDQCYDGTEFHGRFLDPTWFFTTAKKSTNTKSSEFDISKVIFNDPATVVFWSDGTKTVVKCQEGDEYSEEVGLALCIAKKALGNKSNFNNVFKKWLPKKKLDMATYEIPKLNLDASTIASNVMTKFKEALHRQRGDISND